MADTEVVEWTGERIDGWYKSIEKADVPATHVISGTIEFRLPIVIPPWHTGRADDIAAEMVAAWQQMIAEDGPFEFEWIDNDHPAHDCLFGRPDPSSPGAMFRIAPTDNDNTRTETPQ